MTASTKFDKKQFSSNVNDHFVFFKLLYNYASDYYVVQKV